MSLVEIKKTENEQYCLIFNPSDIERSIDGYAWELLIKAYCRDEKISLEDVNHDPESDMYGAFASDIRPLEGIAVAIEALASNNILRDKLLKVVSELTISRDDDDMSTEEFLEWMSEAGYDMSTPKAFIFDLDCVKDEEQAKAIQIEVERKGYKTETEILDDEVYFQVKVSVKPVLDLVLEIESSLESVARKYNAKYIGFGI